DIEAVSGCAVGETVHACLRPENVTISVVPVKSSARNAFEGVVIEIEPMGALLRVKVDCGFMVNSFITKQSALELGLELGKRVTISFKATAVHVV
ncbi:MAG: TOBE domain-containing protein, partial [Methanosarcinales archaeon]|nr:TOBE domain-containing protein [Methanosarcinales archaeon]